MKRKSRNKSESNREGISNESGIALALDPELLQKAIVTQQELKEFEKFVPTVSERPTKKYITCPVDESSASGFGFVIFDTETSCAGKQAEIIQLAAETKQGTSFSRFTTLLLGQTNSKQQQKKKNNNNNNMGWWEEDSASWRQPFPNSSFARMPSIIC